ncbi:MAG: hypothetical protein G01um101448_13 [Parcubacteria group bacterium Gr01-1014_48]|nr:MAG: hypothetical protein Greene041614_375 [Parcubacteria group bacterium Greene0416_14]TSC74598.1 MAG: hypothetical protein G01um101448_13 [Parcubacteria group bacterium Gr01-1014_48]TSD01603.1 MAG: hypothetical protein Greene101415_183 [Parcubacteria group bacterium Greene1014_15]TSD08348.1 MAG: hypothetical protein Greene07144_143 [Parcubacteria group bacterium Greene0714_4]
MDSTGILFHHESVMYAAPYALLISVILFFCIAHRLATAQKKIFKKGALSMHLRYTLCGTIAIASMLVAFAGPYRHKTDILQEEIGAKIAIFLDNSPSMAASDISHADKTSLAARDLRPSRLGLCVANISNALADLIGAEIILFTFSGSTDLRTGDWVQLSTHSYRAFSSLLHDIEPSFIGAGTDMSRIFEEAHHILQKEPSFIILCSDGGKDGSHMADVVLRLKVNNLAYGPLRDRNIPIYVLGTGTPGTPAPIPFTSSDGRIQGFIQDGSGNNVLTEYDPVTLRQIATLSGGIYMHADDLYSGRNLIRNAIMSGLRNNHNITVVNPNDLSLLFIVASLFFFSITSGSFSFLKWFRKQS